MVVTVDGPAGAGKSSVSRALAAALGFAFLDTGALYRAVALAASQSGLDLADEAALAAWLPGLELEARPQGGRFLVLLSGQDVEPFIRGEAISQVSSQLSALAPVRSRLLELQRAAGRAGDLVAEGRDMGTVVFPRAEAKFFLTATDQERARRRWRQLRRDGREPELEQVLAEMQRRDQRDQARTLSPLRPAPDAEVVDSTDLSLEQVVDLLLGRISQLRRGLSGPNETL
ncbi:MAG: (d)CMP kinase [Desulfarculus sp.]|nr:MAG: (d)CMP kinase [Desulfarculus sp.]